jgi:hypothetical protein
MQDLNGRHPVVQDVAQWFHYEHLPEELQVVSKLCHDLAGNIIEKLPDSPQLTIGLQHLLIAKDAFVRGYLKTSGVKTPLATDSDHS